MPEGIVFKSTGSNYKVKDENGLFIECKIKGNIRLRDLKSTNPVAVGDKVLFTYDSTVHSGVIHEISDRKNYIIRKSPNLSKQYQILASNIDQAYIMVTLSFPETQTEFIDRFLATAEAYNIPAILLFNKADLYNKDVTVLLDKLISVYENAGYRCIKTSAVTGLNVEMLRDKMKGKINLIAGNSGVGKSSLINAIDSSLNLKTGEISEYHQKGMHTTTFSEMFELNSGGYIIDSPGIKGFGLIDLNKHELFHFFPDIFMYSSECRFNNCRHENEPKCAVRENVESGKISAERYNNYLRILHENEGKYR